MAAKKRSKPKTKPKRTVGRPTFRRDAMSEYVQFRVTPTQRALLRAYAADAGLSEADFMRVALDAYFEHMRER